MKDPRDLKDFDGARCKTCKRRIYYKAVSGNSPDPYKNDGFVSPTQDVKFTIVLDFLTASGTSLSPR